MRHPTKAVIPHIPSNGIKLASPCSPISCPRLDAPYRPAASAAVSIESRLTAICPDQNSGHVECTIGQLSCIASWEVGETTIMLRQMLITAIATIARRPPIDARSQQTAEPRHSIGIPAPAYRGPNVSP